MADWLLNKYYLIAWIISSGRIVFEFLVKGGFCKVSLIAGKKLSAFFFFLLPLTKQFWHDFFDLAKLR